MTVDIEAILEVQWGIKRGFFLIITIAAVIYMLELQVGRAIYYGKSFQIIYNRSYSYIHIFFSKHGLFLLKSNMV